MSLKVSEYEQLVKFSGEQVETALASNSRTEMRETLEFLSDLFDEDSVLVFNEDGSVEVEEDEDADATDEEDESED